MSKSRRTEGQEKTKFDMEKFFNDLTPEKSRLLLEEALRWIDQQWEEFIVTLVKRDPALAKTVMAGVEAGLDQDDDARRQELVGTHVKLAEMRKNLEARRATGEVEDALYVEADAYLKYESARIPQPSAKFSDRGRGLRNGQHALLYLDPEGKNAWLKRIMEQFIVEGGQITPVPKFLTCILIIAGAKNAGMDTDATLTLLGAAGQPSGQPIPPAKPKSRAPRKKAHASDIGVASTAMEEADAATARDTEDLAYLRKQAMLHAEWDLVDFYDGLIQSTEKQTE